MGYAGVGTEEGMTYSTSMTLLQDYNRPSPRGKKGGKYNDGSWMYDVEHAYNSIQVNLIRCIKCFNPTYAAVGYKLEALVLWMQIIGL